MKKQERLKFQIDQLRKEKMVLALESIALTFIVELGYILISIFTRQPFSPSMAALALLLPIAYYLYMAVGNFKRRNQIRELEKELFK